MPFDLSRVRFHARNDFLGVVMQQGRVQLDADWNEWVAELGRRLQAGTLDTFGQAVVPRETTPDGFHIEAASGALRIEPGRIYVDGLLAENHGEAPDAWNPHLAELTGTAPVDYTDQPYLPNAPGLPGGGPHLVYVDVWQRDVSYLEDPTLVEQAVGVDSTGRLQTVWQVKVLPDVGDIDCTTPDAEIPDWPETIAPSAGRLSTATGDPPGDPDPCEVPPEAGYRGLENQLYRVEIHRGGSRGAATFKWSRDNATVATTVTHVNPARNRLTVESTGRDDVLGFHDGDWVEITDDWRELHNEPGELRRIRLNRGVDGAAKTIALQDPLPGGAFPVDGDNATDPARHTRIRRWDQSGQVREEDGSSHVDLDAAGSDGEIPMPAAGTRLFLEHGILVDFDLDPAGGEFKSGDYWVFAGRSADASVEILEQAPPQGIHHHYARLSIVTFPNGETDCRTLWPPLGEGESCDCSVCVHADAHNDGSGTIQQAIDQIAAVGGTLCLGPGTYEIREPLRLERAESIRIRGQGWRTVLFGEEPGSILEVTSSTGVALENLTIYGSAGGSAMTAMIRTRDVVDLRLEHTNIVGLAAGDATSAAIEMSGYALGCAITDCALVAERGVVNSDARRDYLLTAHLQARDNVLLCSQRGFSFDEISFHYGACAFENNLILLCSQAAIVATGGVLPGSSLSVSDNILYATGVGIRAGVDGLRIQDNEITYLGRGDDDGIVLEQGLDLVSVDHVRIVGNRISRMGGNGIAIRHRLEHGMIKQNTIADVGLGAIVMEDGGGASHLVVENNHFLDLGQGFDDSSATYAAVQVIGVDQMDLQGNVFDQVARAAVSSPSVSGVLAGGVNELRAAANRLVGVGPDRSGGTVAGLRCIVPFAQLAVNDNTVRRADAEERELSLAAWHAIEVTPWLQDRERETGAPSTHFAYFAVDERAILLTATNVRAVSGTSGAAAIRGNRLQGQLTSAPLVRVEGVETCLFTENHCQGTGGSDNLKTPLGDLRANVVNASNNRLIGVGELDTLRIQNDAGRGVVIGNMSTGKITVDGGALPAPFDELNVFGV